MLGMPYLLLGVIGSLIYRSYRSAGRTLADGGVPSSDLPS